MLLNSKILQPSIVVLLISTIFLSSCNNKSHSEKGDSAVVQDVLGREVVVPVKVEKIVGLRAGALRMLVYMDAVSLIAGIEHPEKKGDKPYLNAHPELINLPDIGPAMGGDAEMILNVNPDVIFISYTTKEDADALQKKTGIPVVAIECSDLGTESELLFESMKIVGKIINKESRADSLISYISSSIKHLNNRTKDIEENLKPSVYVGGLSYSSSYGISATHSSFAPFMFLNANNVASGIDKRLTSHVKGTFVDIEKILMWNPEMLFIDEAGFSLTVNDIKTRSALRKSLKAVDNDQIFCLLPYNNYATNYEYILINAWYIGKQLYPENFEDVDFKLKAAEIIEAFYNSSNSSDLLKSSLVLRKFSYNEL